MGIETAIIGSALLGAGASVASARQQSRAVGEASDTQQQAAQQEIALNRDIYQDQRNLFMPYYQMGLQGMYGGGASLNNLLGISGGPAQVAPGQATPYAQPATPSIDNAFSLYASGNYGMQTPAQQQGSQWQAYLDANPDVMNYIRNNPRVLREFGGDPLRVAEHHYNTFGRQEGRQLPSVQPITPQQPQAPSAPPPVAPDGNGGYRQTGDQTAQLAQPATPTEGPMTQTLRQTPGYQFLQDESRRAVENSFASRGKLLSGAAMDALNTRTLGIADQTYQQSVNNAFNVANLGLGSAAQIGNAGTNYANSASMAIGNSANAQANAQIGRANAFSQGLQGVANSASAGLGMYGGYRGWFG